MQKSLPISLTEGACKACEFLLQALEMRNCSWENPQQVRKQTPNVVGVKDGTPTSSVKEPKTTDRTPSPYPRAQSFKLPANPLSSRPKKTKPA